MSNSHQTNIVWIFLCALLLSLDVSAQTLSGIVFGGNYPIPDTVVTLLDSSTQSVLDTDTTDNNGVYSFTVSVGTYDLDVAPPSGSGFANAVVANVVVSGADTIQNIVLLEEAYIVSGTVYASDGTTPMPNILVRLDPSPAATGIRKYTDSLGRYSLEVPAGTYELDALYDASVGATGIPFPDFIFYKANLSLSVSANLTEDIVLPQVVTLSGKTTDSTGVPVPGVDLLAGGDSASGDISSRDNVVSGSNGDYLLHLLPGTFNIEVTPPSNSGFVPTIIVDVVISNSIFLNIILELADLTDTTPPVLTLLGSDPFTVECGSVFEDPGATSSDDVDGNITEAIVVTNPVDTSTPGSYTVTYNVEDSSGNAATPITRTVEVVDTLPPSIDVLGSSPVSVDVDSLYVDAGAVAFDACEGDLTADIVTDNPVDTSFPGLYTVTYTVLDSFGNTAQASRIVIVALSSEDLCQSLVDAIEAEWALLAAELGLNPNIVETPGQRIPERWGLAMVRQVICRPSHPHHAATVEAYLFNLGALEDEPVLIADSIAPYKHVLAALLLINQARQDHFKGLLGLTNTYMVARDAARAGEVDIFGDDGDLDGDGISNADEYDFIIGGGGSIEDFAEAVIKGALALGLVVTILAFLGLLAVGVSSAEARNNRG